MEQTYAADDRGELPGKPSRPAYGTIALLLGAAFLAAFFFVEFARSGIRDGGPPGANRCVTNLRNVAAGLDIYRKIHGHFPASVVRVGNQPPRSWRVQLLDIYDQPDLASRYDRNAKWYSASNRHVMERVLQLFICPRSAYDSPPGPRTDYVLVTGPGTAFPSNKTTTAADITDGLNRTIVLIEIPTSQIYWTEPRDISREEAVLLFNRIKANPNEAPHGPTGHPGFSVGFADGRASYLPVHEISCAQFDGLLTIAGGEPPLDLL